VAALCVYPGGNVLPLLEELQDENPAQPAGPCQCPALRKYQTGKHTGVAFWLYSRELSSKMIIYDSGSSVDVASQVWRLQTSQETAGSQEAGFHYNI
jgi:hypothetical protein